MRIDASRLAWLVVGLAVLGAGPANAQTDVSASVFGAFSRTVSGDGSTDQPSNAAGGMVEVRHISNPFVGFEATYSFNRANQVESTIDSVCGIVCGPLPPVTVSVNEHEFSADWVASLKVANLRPFALAGVGVLVFEPTGTAYASDAGVFTIDTSTATKPAFVYGVGTDWGVLPHVGLRLQYRGNIYKAPQFVYNPTGATTEQSEVMVGVYFRL